MNIYLVLGFLIFYVLNAQSSLCPSNCVDCDISTNTCFACQESHELTTSSRCLHQFIDKCTLFGTNNQCLKCQSTYYLDGSVCNKQYSGCLSYNIDKTCRNCLNGFRLISGKCVGVINCRNYTNRCAQCNQGYNLSNNLCVDTTGNCQTFDQNLGACTKCANKYQLIGYQCISINIYPYACQIYNTSGACFVCQDGYILFSIFCYSPTELKSLSNGNIVPPRRIYMNLNLIPANEVNISSAEVQNSIIKNHINNLSNQSLSNSKENLIPIANCVSYDQLNKSCNFCRTNYVLVQNKCYYMIIGCSSYITSLVGVKCSQCLKNYQLDVSGVCYQKLTESNIENCLISNSNSNPQICIVCNQAFYLIRGNCYTTLNPDLSQINNTSQISQNKSNSPLATTNNQSTTNTINLIPNVTSVNGSKTLSSTDNTNKVVSKDPTQDEDPNCVAYYPNQRIYCQKCAQDFFYNILTGKCQRVSVLCRTFDSNSGKCFSCYSGYSLNLGDCVASTITPDFQNDLNCKIKQNNTCTQCYKGFYLNKQMTCKQANPICKNVDSSGLCTSCYVGYWLVKGTCTTNTTIINNLDSYDENCKNIENGACSQCYPGYRLYDNSCLVTNPLCKRVSLRSGSCLSCYQGYFLSEGQCYIKESNSPNLLDPFCTKILNLQCLQCVQGYYLSQQDGTCQVVNTNCQTINKNDGSCTSCNYGYVLAGGQCFQQTLNCIRVNDNGECVNCITGFYLKQSQCYPKSISCLQYDQNSGNCIKCVANHILFKNNCIFPTFGFDPLCADYVNSYCTACVEGSYLLRYQCVKISPQCIQFDYKRLRCLKCTGNLRPRGTNCA